MTGNFILNLDAGAGGTGGIGLDDTGYGGIAGDGGPGGTATGIVAITSSSVIGNNLVETVMGGDGGDGGDGGGFAPSGMGGTGGTATGVFDLLGSGELSTSTVINILGGSGGQGGAWYPAASYTPEPGGDGGDGGSAYSFSTTSSGADTLIRNNILTGTNPGTGGSGGYGDPYGAGGASGTGYGVNADFIQSGETGQRALTIEYNDVWNHATGLYHNVTPASSNISADPLFTAGPDGIRYLSQVASGQASDSPCVNAGSGHAGSICYSQVTASICMSDRTTRTDDTVDEGIVDLGFHYAPGATPTPTPADIPATGPAGLGVLCLIFGILLLIPRMHSAK